ncbi:hypothetical protein [Enterobacillus tribolii]|nr:hypothetical protein [Enterobacillus tribolii]
MITSCSAGKAVVFEGGLEPVESQPAENDTLPDGETDLQEAQK